jgi:integrase
MAVKRGKDGRWRFRVVVRDIMLADGTHPRISGTPTENTKEAARAMEREEVRLAIEAHRNPPAARKEFPTFDEWFNGRFWREWVVGKKNKPSEVESKLSIYKLHLKEALGRLPLNEVAKHIPELRASLVERKLSEKRINNILAVVSKPLRYAADVEVLDKAPPTLGLFKVERPEIEFWELEEYARILEATRHMEDVVHGAACLAGEAGLRVGEVKALRWREDVDMVARTITVKQQMRRGVIGTPKGRTRRTIPMTDTLFHALNRISTVREGYVIRNLLGEAKNEENQIKNLMYRICRKAGLREKGWHTMRHSYATHAAMFGVNPWRLMAWLGHKRIEETMRYVHVAQDHLREVPRVVLEAGAPVLDPDRRVLAMLGARHQVPWQNRGKENAAEESEKRRLAVVEG